LAIGEIMEDTAFTSYQPLQLLEGLGRADKCLFAFSKGLWKRVSNFRKYGDGKHERERNHQPSTKNFKEMLSVFPS